MNVPAKPAARVPAAGLAPPVELDFVHRVGNVLLAYGWVGGLSTELASARLQLGDWRCDLLSEAVFVARPDVSSHLAQSGLTFLGDGHVFFRARRTRPDAA